MKPYQCPFLMIFLLLSPLSGIQARQSKSPLITPTEVAEHRLRHEAQWRHNTENDSKLFFSEQDWPSVRKRILELENAPGQWRELALQTAEAIIAQPIPVYREHEEFVDEKTTILQAREELWQRQVGNNIAFLAFMAKIHDNPAYKTYLRDLTLAALDFKSWGHGMWRDQDLAAAHILRGVAMAWDWHRDIFDPEQQKFIKETIARRTPTMLKGLYGGIFWGNEYRANHNHISVAALGLTGLAFLDDIPEAGDWLSGALLNYDRVAREMNHDGSSEEGLGYWSYGMNFILQFIEGTRRATGSDALYKSPFLKNTVLYRLASSTPGFDGVLLWGDATGRDYYGPHHILLRLASEYQDPKARFLVDNLPFSPRGAGPTATANDVLAFSLLWYDPTIARLAPIELDHHLPDWEVITSRSGWDRSDYLFSLKSGLNNLHHSHLDAGAITFNFGGTWLLTAPGYGSHGAEGFWERGGRRWTFFSNATEAHSTLLINGKNQRHSADAGATVTRLLATPSTLFAEVDLSRAYDDILLASRRVLHRRGEYLIVFDHIISEIPVKVEWLAQVPPRAIVENGALVIAGNNSANLRIEMPNARSFSDRKPTSPHYNLPPDRLKTLAVSKEGERVQFATLLRPFFPGDTAEVWETDFEESEKRSIFRIKTENWNETIEVFSDPHEFEKVGDFNIKGKAGFLCVRRDNRGTVTSVIAADARNLQTSIASFSTEEPINVSLESSAKDRWLLVLSNDFEGSLFLASPFVLSDESGKSIASGEKVFLRSGNYVLNSDARP